ncbi:MAG: hypothetical protein MH472_14325 [Bacteroidia bacterium]|nr:hypothetical protein [Bacteroidia bacterium]
MNNFVAKAVSVIWHPVFVNLLCLYILFTLYPPLSFGVPQKLQWFYIGFIFISTSIVPLLLVLIMKLTGRISAITMDKQEDRKYPYLFTLSLYIFVYYNLTQSPITPSFLLKYLLACTAIVGAVFLINSFNKISIHLATMGALCGLLATLAYRGFADYRMLLAVAIMASGYVASARLTLKAHLPNQLYLGFLLGLFLMFFILNLNYTFA